MRKLPPAHIEHAFRSLDAGFRTLKMRVEEPGGVKDDVTRDLLLAIGHLTDGLKIVLEIIPHRIEELHQKVDRIEKKIGSV